MSEHVYHIKIGSSQVDLNTYFEIKFISKEI